MKPISIETNIDELMDVRAGDTILLSGTIYTARDRALDRIIKEKRFPKFLKGKVIYHAGPSLSNEKGYFSCGPTTSKRMEVFLDKLFSNGVIATIGKGEKEIVQHKRFKAIYLLATGGCGALYGSHIKKMESVLYNELGTEAVYRTEISKFPLIVGIDINGKSIFNT